MRGDSGNSAGREGSGSGPEPPGRSPAGASGVLFQNEWQVIARIGSRYYKLVWTPDRWRQWLPFVYEVTLIVGDCALANDMPELGYHVHWRESGWTSFQLSTIPVNEGVDTIELRRDPVPFLTERLL